MRWTLLILSGLLLAGLVFGGCGSDENVLVGPESDSVVAEGVDKRPGAPTIPPTLPIPYMVPDFLSHLEEILSIQENIPAGDPYWKKHEFYLSENTRSGKQTLSSDGWGDSASVKVEIKSSFLPPNMDTGKPFVVLVPSEPNTSGMLTFFKFLDKPPSVDLAVTFTSELFEYPEAGDALYTYMFCNDDQDELELYELRTEIYVAGKPPITFYLTEDKPDFDSGATYGAGTPGGQDD